MKWNDYELLYMIRQGNDTAFKTLIEKYREEIIATIKHYINQNYRYLDLEDYYQMAILKLYDAIKGYRPGKRSFHNFYFELLHNMMIDQIRISNARKKRRDRYALSLDMRIEDAKGSYTLMDIIQEPICIPDDQSELYHDITKACRNMSDLERKIFELRSRGETYRQIAEKLDISVKKVEYIVYKIRKQKKSDRNYQRFD